MAYVLGRGSGGGGGGGGAPSGPAGGVLSGTYPNPGFSITPILPTNYVLLQDQRAANTAGGGSTSGSWQTRTLQTEDAVPANLCSLAADQFTLSAGTYQCTAWAALVGAAQCKNRIRNVTNKRMMPSEQATMPAPQPA